MLSSLVWKVISPLLPPLRMIPTPPTAVPMTSDDVVPLPMSMAPSVSTRVTGPAPPTMAVSAPPKTTPSDARSTVRSPSRCVVPMLALNTTRPASSSRLFRSKPTEVPDAIVPSWLLIVAEEVNVMLPTPVLVSICVLLCSRTAPLMRTSSPLV